MQSGDDAIERLRVLIKSTKDEIQTMLTDSQAQSLEAVEKLIKDSQRFSEMDRAVITQFMMDGIRRGNAGIINQIRQAIQSGDDAIERLRVLMESTRDEVQMSSAR